MGMTDGYDPRRSAKLAGAKIYGDICSVHGPAQFSVKHAKCLICYTASGMRRAGRVLNPERIAARKAGDHSYTDWCDTHGPVPHDTARGKCRHCFTTLGKPRKYPKPPSTYFR